MAAWAAAAAWAARAAAVAVATDAKRTPIRVTSQSATGAAGLP